MVYKYVWLMWRYSFFALHTFRKMKVTTSSTVGSSWYFNSWSLTHNYWLWPVGSLIGACSESSFYRKVTEFVLLTTLHTFRKMKVTTSLIVGSSWYFNSWSLTHSFWLWPVRSWIRSLYWEQLLSQDLCSLVVSLVLYGYYWLEYNCYIKSMW